MPSGQVRPSGQVIFGFLKKNQISATSEAKTYADGPDKKPSA
jgi:hypothetical protein